MIKKRNIFFITLLFFILPYTVSAAVLYMDPAEGQVGPGDSIAVDLKIDVGENCINTIDVNLAFPQEVMKLTEIITGDSIVNLWVESPDSSQFEKINQDGLFRLSGGIPGGFCGRIPGDPGFSNIIARLVFTRPSLTVSDVDRDRAEIKFLEDSRVFINDGMGTVDKIMLKNSSLALAKIPIEQNKDWEQQLKNDKTPPEPFIIEVQQSPAIFNGFYYVIFSTSDKQSGVDRYEIQEVDIDYDVRSKEPKRWYDKLIGSDLFVKEPAPWKIAVMPAVLSDQSLKSIIRIKAVDKAGNERLEEYIPPESMRPAVNKTSSFNEFLLLSIVGVFVIFIIILIIVIIKKRRSHAEETPSVLTKK